MKYKFITSHSTQVKTKQKSFSTEENKWIGLYFKTCMFLLLLVTISGISAAQSPSPEYLYADFDKDFYIAGEDLWYAIHFLEPAQQQSKVVYIELVSPEGNTLVSQILKAKASTSSGDILIPAGLNSGYYRFRAYTQWNLNFSPMEIYEVDIPVYEAGLELQLEDNYEVADVDSKQVGGINLEWSKAQTEIDSTASLSLQFAAGTFDKGAVSISVMDLAIAHPTEEVEILRRKLSVADQQNQLGTEPPYQAEEKIRHQFILKNPESEEPIISNFISGYVHQSQQKIIEVAKKGEVEFEFEDFYDSTVLQIFDANPYDPSNITPEVSLMPQRKASRPRNLDQTVPPLTPQVKAYLQDNRQRFLIHQLFDTPANVPMAEQSSPESKLEPASSYKVEDYEAVRSTEEMVKDIVPSVRVTRKRVKNKQTGVKKIQRNFKLFIPYQGWWTDRAVPKPPILLINNYLSYEVEAALSIPIENLRQVDIFNDFRTRGIHFGPVGNFGVVAFYTHDEVVPDAVVNSSNNIAIKGLYPSRKFNQNLKHPWNNDVIPNFNPVLYWNPQLEVQDGEASVEFWAGDRPATYLVRIEGVDANGEIVFAETLLEVIAEE